MKAKLVIIIGCLGLFFSSYSFGGCGGSGGCSSYNACSDQFDCEYCSTCECTDPNAGHNNCLSKSEACEAFGNIGAR